MSENDINEGIMRISVKAAPSRPAEFIVITFEQKNGK
jgi:phage tail sheath protein FI